MILCVLMQFTLSSCFTTPSESVAVVLVLVVDCPNLNRAPAFIPSLHPSSINLAALILFALSSSPILVIPPNLTTIYTLCSKSLQSFLTSLEERTVEST